ncbi:MAG: sigma-54 dependent transcriptional regulator [Candidatus Delongbacteria bacterium]
MTAPRLSILVVDDERAVREVVGDLLREMGHVVVLAGDGEEALRKLDEQDFQLVLSDVRMPRLDGLQLLDAVIERHPGTRILLFTGYGTIQDAVAAIKRGAMGYITKPVDFPALMEEITRLAHDLSLTSSGAQLMNEMLRRHQEGLPLSRNRRMNNLVQLTVSRIAESQASVLITGESGTGKELMAALIHRFSPRRDGPFVKLSAAAIPESLLESELFGHVKGAFTGAVRDRRGRVAEADGGTLFLDEIGEIRPALQAKLLRVLQEREFEPVGSTRTCRVDLRLITATNRDLPAEIAAGNFRPDLYYRLNVLDIHLPPLRERREDLPELVDFILERLCRRAERPLPRPTEALLARLAELDWPGNIRELENVLERCLLLGRDEELDLSHLPEEYRQNARPGRVVPGSLASLAQLTLDEAREHFEHELLLQVLEEECGNVSACARRLGIARKNLQIKLKRLGIEALGFRAGRESGRPLPER